MQQLRDKYMTLEALAGRFNERTLELGPWINSKEHFLPSVNHKQNNTEVLEEKQPTLPQKQKITIEPRFRYEKPQAKIKLSRLLHKVSMTDINETATLTLVPATQQSSLKGLHLRMRSSAQRKDKTVDTMDSSRQLIVSEDQGLQKQFSRYLYEMHSEVSQTTPKRMPFEFSRKRRILEMFNLSKASDERSDKKNLKVAYDKFNTFIPISPKKKATLSPKNQRNLKAD